LDERAQRLHQRRSCAEFGKRLEEQTTAGLKVQASFKAELDGLRKLLTRAPAKRTAKMGADTPAPDLEKSADRSRCISGSSSCNAASGISLACAGVVAVKPPAEV